MISTLTNAAYLVAGLMVGGVYGVALAALGIASAGFHAGRGRRWQAADECMMYVVLCCLAALWGVPAVLAAVCAIALVVAHPRISSFTWVPVLAGVNVVLIGAQDLRQAAALLVLAGTAFLIRQYGAWRGGLTEDIAHGVWHVLTAAALYLSVP